MSDDQKTIQLAYADQLSGMFEVFFQSSLTDGLDDAAAKMTDGLAKLRAARDRALTIVGN